MKFIMNFLRSPFQFRSTDQSSKKSESASPVVENMFIDPSTGISMDPKWRATSPGIGTSSSGSPRLQHRVPGFESNGGRPVEVIHEPAMPQGSSNEDGEKPQRVRVVPITVESVDDSSSPKKRAGAFHSASGTIPRSSQFGSLHPNFEELQNRKRHSSGPATSQKKGESSESKPKVCNIPIFVEGRDTPVVPRTSPSSQNVPTHNVTPTTPDKQIPTAKQNGGNLSKCSTKTKSKQEPKQNNHEISLKQITDILAEFETLKTSVDEFKGVPQDKQYRYLDEMLTRCMLKLDNVETHGDDAVRASRKAAVKAIEKCITDLESHAQANTKLDQPAAAEEKCSPSEDANSTQEEVNVLQDQIAGSAEQMEKHICSELSNTAEDEKMDASREQSGAPVCKDTHKTDEDLSSSVEHAAEKINTPRDKQLCAEGNDSAPPESTETSQTLAENTECVDKNSQDVENSTMDVGETTEESGGRTQVQVDQPVVSVEHFETPEAVAEAGGELMEATEVADVPLQSVDLPRQGEPMDSAEVPEAKVQSDLEEIKGETVDSEMVELIHEPISAENNNSFSTKTSN